MDGQKTEIDIKKCGEMMILVILLQTSRNSGRSGNGTTSEEKYLEARKKPWSAVYQSKCIKQESKVSETLCGEMIRNLMK